MNNIKFCIWDMGGVIYDWSFEPFNRWCFENSTNKEELSKKIGTFDFNPHMSGLKSDLEVAEKMCAFYHIPFRNGIEQEMCNMLKAGDGPEFAITPKMMKYVLSKGAKNALLSNTCPAFIESWRNDELMDGKHRFFSFDLKLLKPDVEIYKVVRERLGVEFEELIFVDDKKENIEAACSLGIKGIVFDEKTIEDEIRKLL